MVRSSSDGTGHVVDVVIALDVWDMGSGGWLNLIQ